MDDPEKLTTQDLESLKTLVDSGIPIKTIAAQWKISRTTVYRYLNKIEKNEEDQTTKRGVEPNISNPT